jgi:hypothetical protein
MMFATNDALAEHLQTHNNNPNDTDLTEEVDDNTRSPSTARGSSRKRKIDEVTPLIEPMPSEMAKRNRPVYSGPSRTFSVGQKRR